MAFKKGTSYLVSPSMKLKQFDAKYQNHGFTTHQSSYFGFTLGATGALDYRFKAKENSPMFRLGLSADAGSYSADVSDSKLFAIDGITGAFTDKQTISIDSSTMSVSVEPTYYYPFSSSLSTTVSAVAGFNIPDTDIDEGWGIFGGKLGVVYERYKYSVKLGGSVANLFDNNTGMSTIDMEGSAKVDVKLGKIRAFSSLRYLTSTDPSFRSKDRYRYLLADPRIRYVDDYFSQLYVDGGASVDVLGAEIEARASFLSKAPYDVDGDYVITRDYQTDPIATSAEQVIGFFRAWDFPTHF